MFQQFHYWIYIQKKENQYIEKSSPLQCLLQHSSQQPKHEINLLINSRMNFFFLFLRWSFARYPGWSAMV